MEIKTLASGSLGNCYIISSGSIKLMIECGLPISEIRKRSGYNLADISACLVSHEHLDHCKAVRDLVKFGVDCYMTEGTAEALSLKAHEANLLQSKKVVNIGDMKVMPFPAEHDAAEPVGFLVEFPSGEKLVFLTDSHFCRYQFRGVTHYMLECNYIAENLEINIEAGVTPILLRKRLNSSHFGLNSAKRFFETADLSRTKEIHLIHMSKTNADPETCKREIQSITGKPVYVHYD